jgi:hypothetical protein
MSTQKYLCKCKFGKFGGILACLAILTGNTGKSGKSGKSGNSGKSRMSDEYGNSGKSGKSGNSSEFDIGRLDHFLQKICAFVQKMTLLTAKLAKLLFNYFNTGQTC